jgi:hypothetical protein
VKGTTFFLALIVAALVMGGNASGAQFKKAAYHNAGQLPRIVVAADFNNDGSQDVVIADYLSNQVSVLIGKGDGTFKKARLLSVPSPIGVTNADINGDGNEDLVIIESGGSGNATLAIFLGDGKGNFHAKSFSETGIATISASVADFNHDGYLDVAVANKGSTGSGDIMVFLGLGDGTFKKPKTYKTGGNPYGIAAGDLNGDGLPDLAVANLDGSVSVLLNDGTGRFPKSIDYNAGGGEVADVKIADLRNNGKQDLVVANASQGMVVLLNNGHGTFGKPTTYQPTFQDWQPPSACVVADFNLDGNLDVACAPNFYDSYLFYGKGNGQFGSGVEIHDAIKFDAGFSLAAGDFNNDKAPDLAIPIELKGKVAIMLNAK